MSHISKRTSRSLSHKKSFPKKVTRPTYPFDQHATADVKRDGRLVADLENDPEIDRIALLRREMSDAESEADGVLADRDQLEAKVASAPIGIAPDPNESERMD